MDLKLWKIKKKELKLTNQKVSDLSGVPKRTVEDIFSGTTKSPRSDTVDAIEKVLGLDKSPSLEIPAENWELFEVIKNLNEDQTKEMLDYLQYILSKRK